MNFSRLYFIDFQARREPTHSYRKFALRTGFTEVADDAMHCFCAIMQRRVANLRIELRIFRRGGVGESTKLVVAHVRLPRLGAKLRFMSGESFDSLHDLILAKRDRILQRWIDELQQSRATPSLLPGELRDHVPTFLDDLTDTLGALVRGTPSDESFRPSMHGVQRLRVGFDVDAVVREYGLLGDVILAVADSVSYRPTSTEYRALSRQLFDAASRTVASYARRRDDELRIEAGKHVAFVAHELRNPLHSATMALALLKPDAPLAKPMQSLERSIGRLRDLVDNMLVAGRLDSHVTPKLERIVVPDLLSLVREDVLPHAEARGVGIRYVSAESLIIEADSRLLASALGNLVHNAVKFTRPGSEVTINGRALESKVMLEVEDQCGGLPDGKEDELFTPFVQRGGDRSGFGLGLSIAKHAVTAHSGRIYVTDRPGSGCTFTIELPAAPDKA